MFTKIYETKESGHDRKKPENLITANTATAKLTALNEAMTNRDHTTNHFTGSAGSLPVIRNR